MYHDRITLTSGAATGHHDPDTRAWVPDADADPSASVLWNGSCMVQDDVETIRKAQSAQRPGRESTPADAIVFLPRPLYRRVVSLVMAALGAEDGGVAAVVTRTGSDVPERATVLRASRTDGTLLLSFD